MDQRREEGFGMEAREEENVDEKAALEAKDTERRHGSGTEH